LQLSPPFTTKIFSGKFASINFPANVPSLRSNSEGSDEGCFADEYPKQSQEK